MSFFWPAVIVSDGSVTAGVEAVESETATIFALLGSVSEPGLPVGSRSYSATLRTSFPGGIGAPKIVHVWVDGSQTLDNVRSDVAEMLDMPALEETNVTVTPLAPALRYFTPLAPFACGRAFTGSVNVILGRTKFDCPPDVGVTTGVPDDDEPPPPLQAARDTRTIASVTRRNKMAHL
jgi:hypothetical protein